MSDPEAALLKVAPDAPLAALKKAYRKAALAHHPDQNPDPAAARHFRKLTEAYRTLEAQALLREPPRPAKAVPLADRVLFLVGDIGALVRRWPADRWLKTVDGLPAAVWVASILGVLDRLWPGAEDPVPVTPTRDAIALSLGRWPDRLGSNPLPHPVPKALSKALHEALQSSDVRLRALDRPQRGSRP